jgi:predicted Zn-dependent protease
MLQTFKKPIRLSLALLVVLATVIGSSAQSTWTPPAARTNKTPLAPKPHAGSNIFKGEADKWLANAIAGSGDWDTSKDSFVNDYVSQVGHYVAKYSAAPGKEYQFTVTSSLGVDAWNVGGGRIYITWGMLRLLKTEDQLAGILAHEIAHDAFGHIAKTVTRQLFWMTGTRTVKDAEEVEKALTELHAAYAKRPITELGESMLGFSRLDELEADRAAFYNSYKAGYNPLAVGGALKLYASKSKAEDGKKQYWRDEFLMLLFGNHPPDTQRFMALSWEANFVKMPPRDSHYESPGFMAMKKRVGDE